MNRKDNIMKILICIILICILGVGCASQNTFSKKNLFLAGSSNLFTQIRYSDITIKPFDESYSFFLKFPNGKIYHSSEINVELLKKIKARKILNEKGSLVGYEYRCFKIKHWYNSGPNATLSLLFDNSKDNVTFICACWDSKIFQIAPSDKSRFYSMPITYEEAVKIFGKPKKTSKIEKF